ncbi:MAG TPA: NUDIX domain-containing protein, partial [Longimicrobiaceae bacterium]|nr:NUDIX domain-containing protein [Longimicrobiaceae bacterium]
LVRRPANVRLGGLWAFPWAVRHRGESVACAAERAAREGLALAVRAGEEVGAVDHVFTHVRATYHAVLCASRDGEPRPIAYDAFTWVTPTEIAAYALPIAQQRIAGLVAAHLAVER